MEFVRIGFVIPPDWRDELQRLALAKQVSISAVLRWAVDAYLQKSRASPEENVPSDSLVNK